jgi:hypothetical protein
MAHISSPNADVPSGFAADADSDGMPNGMEWLLGGDPLVPDAAPLIGLNVSAADELILDFHRCEDAVGVVNLSVEWSSDLNSAWAEIPIGPTSSVGANGIKVTVDEASSPPRISVHIPTANSPNGKLFARLRAGHP